MFIRSAVMLVMFLIFGCAQSLPVPNIIGLPYHEARLKIIEAGWVLGAGTEFEIYTPGVKTNYPEVTGCAVDRPVCSFSFKGPSKQCLQVFTEGEQMPEFKVYAIKNECEQNEH